MPLWNPINYFRKSYQHECTESRPTYSNACGKGPTLLKVASDAHNGWEIYHTKPDTLKIMQFELICILFTHLQQINNEHTFIDKYLQQCRWKGREKSHFVQNSLSQIQ